MFYLFTHTDFKGLNILPTNNHPEGMFGRIKERVKIHRGLNKKSEEKSGEIFAEKLGAEVRKKPPIFLIMP